MESTGRLVLRVRTADGVARAKAADAVVIPAGPRASAPERYIGFAVPHESEREDTPLTLVVRARPGIGPITVECEAFAPDGTRRVYGRSTEGEAVIVRTPTGIAVTSLPTVEPDAIMPATS